MIPEKYAAVFHKDHAQKKPAGDGGLKVQGRKRYR
jgi:hypothetical protein